MGRHSIPDPEGSSSGPPEGAGDATEQFDQPLVPPDDYRGYRPGPPEPDYPRYGEPDYDDNPPTRARATPSPNIRTRTDPSTASPGTRSRSSRPSTSPITATTTSPTTRSRTIPRPNTPICRSTCRPAIANPKPTSPNIVDPPRNGPHTPRAHPSRRRHPAPPIPGNGRAANGPAATAQSKPAAGVSAGV